MFRDPRDAPGQKTINCLLTDGGLGDHVGALVAVNYIIRTYPYLNVLVWLPDFLIEFAKHVLPPGTSIRGYTEAQKKFDNKRTGITTAWYKHTPMRTHPVDYAFHLLADETPDITKKNYLQIRPSEIDLTTFNLPEKYVVIAATAAEVVKTMPNKTINEVAAYVKEKGYTPVFIGKTETKVGFKDMKMQAKASDIEYSIGIDLVNKTSILETTAIIAGAKAFVGLDGGPVHLAGCTKTPIVVGYTFIDYRHNLPIRNDILGYNCYTVEPDEKKVPCKFCQTRMNFLYDFDFRDCYYRDYACTKEMTPDKFIMHLEGIL